MKSHVSASSKPPPSAFPPNAATTGWGSDRHASKTGRVSPTCSAMAGVPSTGASARRSAPATNAFSPAPVSTIARTSSRPANDRAAWPKASRVASSSALTGGLSTVTVATASATSMETLTARRP